MSRTIALVTLWSEVEKGGEVKHAEGVEGRSGGEKGREGVEGRSSGGKDG